MQDAVIVSVLLATNAKVFATALTFANGYGYGTAVGLPYISLAEGVMGNTGGANGAKSVQVRRRRAFK